MGPSSSLSGRKQRLGPPASRLRTKPDRLPASYHGDQGQTKGGGDASWNLPTVYPARCCRGVRTSARSPRAGRAHTVRLRRRPDPADHRPPFFSCCQRRPEPPARVLEPRVHSPPGHTSCCCNVISEARAPASPPPPGSEPPPQKASRCSESPAPGGTGSRCPGTSSCLPPCWAPPSGSAEGGSRVRSFRAPQVTTPWPRHGQANS